MAAAFVLGTVILCGCSEEESASGVNAADFFKISVSEDSFGEDGENSRSVEVPLDTIITSLDNGLVAETVILEGGPSARAVDSRATTGNYWVVGYKTDQEGKTSIPMEGFLTFDVTDGTATNISSGWSVSPGWYKFACVCRVDKIETDKLSILTTFGVNSMLSDVTAPIEVVENKDVMLSFTMRHKTGRLKVELVSEVGDFSELNVGFKGNKLPKTQKIGILDAFETAPTSANESIAKDNWIVGGSGATVICGDDGPDSYVHLIGGYNYNNASLVVTLKSGRAGDHVLNGQTIKLDKVGMLQNNHIRTAKITVKQKKYTVKFVTGEGGTVFVGSAIYPDSVSGIVGTMVQASAFCKDGYTFDGWYDGNRKITATSGDEYVNGKTFFTLHTKIIAENKTYTAKFKLMNNLNGGATHTWEDQDVSGGDIQL